MKMILTTAKMKKKKKKPFRSEEKTECKAIIVFASSDGTSVIVICHKNFYKGQKAEDRQDMYTELIYLLYI